MAVIRGALGDDERGDTGQRDGRGVLWDDDILNGLGEQGRSDRNDDDRFEGGAVGRLYFSAFTPETGRELFVYDPQTGEAALAADIIEGPDSSFPGELTSLGGELYFGATTPATGFELWRYDPRTGEATLAADINQGPDDSFPFEFTPLGGQNRGGDDVADAPDNDDDDDDAREALTLAELLDDGALPVDGPAGAQQPVTHDSAVALGTGPSIEDLVVAPETVGA